MREVYAAFTALVVFGVPLLASCADRPLNACPYPIAYDKATMNKAADEVDALPPGSVLGGMMADYAQERAKLRACRK